MPTTKPTRDILDNPHPPFPFPSVAFWVLLLAVLSLLILDFIGGRVSAGWSWVVVLVLVCLLFPPTALTRKRGTKADDARLREQIRRWREGGGGSRG